MNPTETVFAICSRDGKSFFDGSQFASSGWLIFGSNNEARRALQQLRQKTKLERVLLGAQIQMLQVEGSDVPAVETVPQEAPLSEEQMAKLRATSVRPVTSTPDGEEPSDSELANLSLARDRQPVIDLASEQPDA